ncbi:uncharacterized protein LOC141910127 [Tubulanus polymorphus]|uniref:uncharacterized protein LOC141910127 n=1 Tax=Tubulanus polymorphus TaxID=672921 RepID=UPI003DA65936
MPVLAIDRSTLLQLSVLLLAIPTQYLVTQYWSSTKEQTKNAIQNLKESYLSTWNSWKEWCHQHIFSRFIDSEEVEIHESSKQTPTSDISESTPKHRNPNGFFAGSLIPRSPRSAHIKYKIGQVIQHKKWGYRGVIVGWDEIALAPEFWLSRNHPTDKPHWRKLPNYAILVDVNDRPQAQTTYVVEENIEVVMDTEIDHPFINDFFDAFDGAQYLPKMWLKELYPHD